jgi:methionyl aminopeptidase
MINLYSREEIEKIRTSCRIIYRIFQQLKELIVPGIRTGDINLEIVKAIKAEDAVPAFLGYRGFPAESCISVNEVVVHGIPGKRKLSEGDIVSVDIGVLKDDFYGDAAVTFPVGEIRKEKKKLLQVTRQALEEGIKKAVMDNRISDISAIIEDTVTEARCMPVRDLVGHGIGRNLHEEPQIPNYRSNHSGCRVQEGMVLAIEPMINLGNWEVETLKDNWTVVTKDRKASAHFEHTVAIIDGKAEVLSIE